MAGPESAIEAAIRQWCRRQGHRAVKVESRMERGIPDRMVFLREGPIVFLEVKSKEGRLSPQQQKWIDFLTLRDEVAVVRSLDDAAEFIERILKYGKQV